MKTSALLMIFAASTALAADPPSSLPAKLPTKKPNAASKVAAPSKLPAKKKSAVAKNSGALPPKQLPAFAAKKKVSISFDSESGIQDQKVVVRTPLPLEEAMKDQTAAANEVTVISKRREPQPTIVAQDVIQPSSDDREVERVAPVAVPVVSAPVVSAPVATPAPRMVEVTRATALPLVLPTKPLPTPAPAPIADRQAAPPEIDYSKLEAHSLVNSDTESWIATSDEIAVSRAIVAKTRAAAPPTVVVEAEAASIAAAPTSSLKTSARVSTIEPGTSRVFVRSGYLSATYSGIEGKLQNGASSMAIAYGRNFEPIEARVSIEIGHGMDQAVTADNTRFVLVRGEGAKFLSASDSLLNPFVGASLGIGDFNVRSYRVSSGNVVLREHVKAMTLVASPLGGLRFLPGPDFTIDVTAEYLLVLGTEASSSLGGLAVSAALGYRF